MKKHNRLGVWSFGLLIIIFFAALTLSGCSAFQTSRVEAHFKTANSEILLELSGSGPAFNNSANKLLVNTTAITNPTYSASDVAVVLTQSKQIKDIEINSVQITDGRYGYGGYGGFYPGSREETEAMEIDALGRYRQSLLKKIVKDKQKK